MDESLSLQIIEMKCLNSGLQNLIFIFSNLIFSFSGSSFSSDVMTFSKCQDANGSFPPKDSVANILGNTLEKVSDAEQIIRSEPSSVTSWMTMVVIVFLSEMSKNEKDLVEPLVDIYIFFVNICLFV